MTIPQTKDKKYFPQRSQAASELKTEAPISEKDEVKQAEDRTARGHLYGNCSSGKIEKERGSRNRT